METMESKDPRHTRRGTVNAAWCPFFSHQANLSYKCVQFSSEIEVNDILQFGGVCHDLAANSYLRTPIPFFYDDAKENKSQPLLLSLSLVTRQPDLPKESSALIVRLMLGGALVNKSESIKEHPGTRGFK